MDKNALVINCSPVRTGATAEIVRMVSDFLSEKYRVRSICIDPESVKLSKQQSAAPAPKRYPPRHCFC